MKKVIFVTGIVDTSDPAHSARPKVVKIAEEIAKIIGSDSAAIWHGDIAVATETARVLHEKLNLLDITADKNLFHADSFFHYANLALWAIEEEIKKMARPPDVAVIVASKGVIYALSGLLTEKKFGRKGSKNIMLRDGDYAVVNLEAQRE